MKKKVFVFVVGIVLGLSVGCGVSNNKQVDQDTVSAEVTEDTLQGLLETQDEIIPVQTESTQVQTESTQVQAEYIKITPEQAEGMMTEDVIILDVRTLEEFEAGHIPNAIVLPDYEIEEKAEQVLKDKNQTILVYCRSGRRSEAATKELIQMGYTKVYDFGGIQDWTGEVVADG